MDKITFASSSSIRDVKRYAVGVMSEGGLHLTPLTSIVILRPKCSYLDAADKRSQADREADDDKGLFDFILKLVSFHSFFK